MEENVIEASVSNGPFTTFQGCERGLSQRIRRILESNVDLAEWNSDYTVLEEFFGDRVQFIDFSLKGEGWFGEISLDIDALDNPYLKQGGPSLKIEILKIVSSCEERIPKKYWKKLTAQVNRLNGELPCAYGSFFYQNPDSGKIQLISQLIKPENPITDPDIFYLLAAHRDISHKFCPSVNRLIESGL